VCAAPCCAAAARPLQNPSVHPCAQRCGLSVAPALVAWPALVDDPSTRERSVLSRAAVSHCVRAGDSPRSNGIRAPLARPPCARAHAQPGGDVDDIQHGQVRAGQPTWRRAATYEACTTRDAAARRCCAAPVCVSAAQRKACRFWTVAEVPAGRDLLKEPDGGAAGLHAAGFTEGK